MKDKSIGGKEFQPTSIGWPAHYSIHFLPFTFQAVIAGICLLAANAQADWNILDDLTTLSLSGFILQQTTNLAAPDWTAADATPEIISDQYIVTQILRESRYYCLAH